MLLFYKEEERKTSVCSIFHLEGFIPALSSQLPASHLLEAHTDNLAAHLGKTGRADQAYIAGSNNTYPHYLILDN